MSKIISIHSFRGGTGKSNTTANVTALLAASGLRIGVIDTDLQSPGIHVLFGVDEEKLSPSLNDYLWGKCEVEEAAQDVTPLLGVPISGQVFLVPASMKPGEITRIVNQGYDPGLLSDGFHRLLDELKLDILMVDTHPGLNEETLLSIAVSDALAIIMRPDKQDFQGTSVTVDVARRLDIGRMVLVVNKVPTAFNMADVKAQVERQYNCDVAAVLPHSDEMMTLASSGIFSLRYPNHPITASLKQVAKMLTE
ncbi:MAG TPA: MinD/ParA family protein [Roseiflexaceae bacterium]|nr:MinD/ParA family protein [Roseiflexaceae bacterium]